MRNIKLTIEYDGTRYYGWQRQPIGNTIQQELEKAISKVIKEYVEVIGSSRTDSGVHAKGYVANFKTNVKMPAEKFRDAINCKLPRDIVIIKSEEVDLDFHARYSSKGKTYCYTILNREYPCAINKDYVYYYRWKLNVEEMKKACKYFLGTHDFKAFQTPGGSVKTSIRTISDLHIETNVDKIKIYISADGFLYNMVRIIVGTLILVGSNKIKEDFVKNIIESGVRQNAGKCAPANGLCLEKVFY
ncbi:tRNA pseudouridine(38-40) synthase TruA [Sarcina ventriculi]|uniref:tRNA pseudouridine synthase A n=1 Tax=Sarcina ventriculi TaxID=1267 RepID=A0ABP2ARR7_SARVE|nr:tRNA pseudouridine(38-40) synthase TruA [Sarcina ventriculi]MBU5323198.1 tRNA pseudouridine(38-40) synthase TruA [Sarcina ventriculi]MDD7372356.1 tRNA pseudouridine(38-40) synthase TruA [Sarcina ventriculi]CUO13127.1 tRNA pseudouridine synthase A [Sarcina ventriculi]